jgi:hypothetical protein
VRSDANGTSLPVVSRVNVSYLPYRSSLLVFEESTLATLHRSIRSIRSLRGLELRTLAIQSKVKEDDRRSL